VATAILTGQIYSDSLQAGQIVTAKF